MKLSDQITRRHLFVAFGTSSQTGSLSSVDLAATRDEATVALTASDGSVAPIAGADASTAGVMTAADKAKLDKLPPTTTREFGAFSDIPGVAVGTGITHLRTAGYSIAGDGGGALYKRVGSEPSHQFKVQSADATWWEGVPERGVINGDAFGAAGDGVADDTAALQAAIDYAQQFISLDLPTIALGRGQYRITSPLTATTSGNHFRLTSPHKRQASIVADAVMGAMLTVGQATGVFSRLRIDGIRFDCNFKADSALDLTYVRYSLIENNEFSKMTAGNPAVILGRWVNRFRHNTINGMDSAGTTPSGHGLHIPNDATNNFVVEENSFTSCAVGLKNNANAHDLHIHRNTFDNCPNAAIWLAVGGRNTTIENNYIEKCGSAGAGNGVDIPAVGGGTVNVNGAIVASWDGTTPSTEFQNLVVARNQFANVSSEAWLVVSGVRGLVFQDNHGLDQYAYDNCVRFVERAALNAPRGIIIDQKNYNGQFTKLVDLAGVTNNEVDHCGFIIRDRKLALHSTGENAQGRLRDLLGDIADWTTSGTGSVALEASKLEGVDEIWKFTGDVEKAITVNLEAAGLSNLRDRYIRVTFLSKGTVATANGIWFRLYTDTGGGLTQRISTTRTSNDAWIVGGRNFTLYVPESATRIWARLRPVSTSDDAFLSRLHIDAASAELRL